MQCTRLSQRHTWNCHISGKQCYLPCQSFSFFSHPDSTKTNVILSVGSSARSWLTKQKNLSLTAKDLKPWSKTALCLSQLSVGFSLRHWLTNMLLFVWFLELADWADDATCFCQKIFEIICLNDTWQHAPTIFFNSVNSLLISFCYVSRHTLCLRKNVPDILAQLQVCDMFCGS